MIVQKALNLTLNELDTKEEDKNSLMLLNVFTEMKAKYFEKHDKLEENENLNKNLSLDEFKQEVFKNIKVEENVSPSKSDVEIMNPYEIFYYFSISNLGELIQDINIFIINCSGIIGKAQFLFKMEFTYELHINIKMLKFILLLLISITPSPTPCEPARTHNERGTLSLSK
jgi:hypothetical protein